MSDTENKFYYVLWGIVIYHVFLAPLIERITP